ncbi:unnamed protein product [Prorocentrum cordatum]|uniref:Uncharacterized protein n=1 Tax=Prorocentrum cordatum TaxID=2364126 RepID=A0ABN9TRB4_9DINO|nr:unnamed protein product [Polarella glacialis]
MTSASVLDSCLPLSSGNACCHRPLFLHAPTPAVNLRRTSHSTSASTITLDKRDACCYSGPFSHALAPAMQLTTAGSKFASHVSRSTGRACSFLAFAVGSTFTFVISLQSHSACCHCLLLAHALVPAL